MSGLSLLPVVGAQLWPVLGHQRSVELLEASLAQGRLAHAYLLTGVHGIGKTTFARALAMRLQCRAAPAPCGRCLACTKVQRELHPDVRLYEGVPSGWRFDKNGPPPPRRSEREKRILKVDQVRELAHWLSQSPFEAAWKIAILRRFEEANDEAANALLKTLEEPPPYALLVLTVADASGLLPTVISRCQQLALRPLTTAAVESALRERWEATPDQAGLLARLAGGRLGWAVQALSNDKLLESRAWALDELAALLDQGRAERLQRAVELSKDTAGLPQLLAEWLTWWRDLLLMQSAGDDAPGALRLTNVDRVEHLRSDAARFDIRQVEQALRSIRAAQRHLDRNANARLVLGVLMLDLPRVS